MPKLRQTDAEKKAAALEYRITMIGTELTAYARMERKTLKILSDDIGIPYSSLCRMLNHADVIRVDDLQKLAAVVPEEEKDRIRKLILP